MGTIHTIMHQPLNFRIICTEWVPPLTAEQRNTQKELSLSHLHRYHEKDYGFFSQIVTGDETWCHHFEPESVRASSSPPPCTPVLPLSHKASPELVEGEERWKTLTTPWCSHSKLGWKRTKSYCHLHGAQTTDNNTRTF
ncbi:histone-lysine N-methyltransferase SETMAR [Trichonephila clavipes]|nr:histone-lysine N-methyltransferase SETMAR [Trichonephila clavipes]